MSDNETIEDVNNIIDKSYNIDYDINDRLRFLQEKYKDYEIKISDGKNNNIRFRKIGTKQFGDCCINFECIKRPNFGIEGQTKATHCKECSKLSGEVMIDINSKKCIKCKKNRPSFCKEGETKTTHCSSCAKIVSKEENIEMEDINHKNKKCIKCNEKIACFCKEGETKTTHCGSCAKIISQSENIKMVNIAHKNKKCIKCNEKIASFCKEDETKATHCNSCANIISLDKHIKMINITSKKCKNIIDGIRCKTQVTKKYDGYCFKCYFKINPDKIPIYNLKIKEDDVVEFIKLTYTKEIRDKYNIKDIRFDKPCGNTNKSPDIAIICENNVIVVEVDEFQHKRGSHKGGKYSKENEENKMNLIRGYYKSQDKKTIYIRFNPDGYLSKDNKKIKSPWKEDENRVLKLKDETDWKNRLEILKQKINYYLKKKEIKNNSTNYLFYDECKN